MQRITSTSVQYLFIWHCKNGFEPSSKTFIFFRVFTDNRYLPRNSLSSYPNIVLYLVPWQLLSGNVIIEIRYFMWALTIPKYCLNFNRVNTLTNLPKNLNLIFINDFIGFSFQCLGRLLDHHRDSILLAFGQYIIG